MAISIAQHNSASPKHEVNLRGAILQESQRLEASIAPAFNEANARGDMQALLTMGVFDPRYLQMVRLREVGNSVIPTISVTPEERELVLGVIQLSSDTAQLQERFDEIVGAINRKDFSALKAIWEEVQKSI